MAPKTDKGSSPPSEEPQDDAVEPEVEEIEEGSSEDSELPTTVEELTDLVADLRVQLKRVTKESIKRKEQIRLLRKSTSDKSSDDKGKGTENTEGDKVLRDENASLKAENARLRVGARSGKIAKLVNAYLTSAKIKLVDDSAKADLAKFVELEIDPDVESDDLEGEVAEIAPVQLRARPYLVAQKPRAPDIDQSKKGRDGIIPDKVVEDIARSFNLPTE